MEERSAEAVWQSCLQFIRDNVNRQTYKTWFDPLRAVSLKEEDDLLKLEVQLPSRFYYEWLEEHYFALLKKTVTKVLGPKGRLFYKIVIEKEDPGVGTRGVSMNLPARQPANLPPNRSGTPATIHAFHPNRPPTAPVVPAQPTTSAPQNPTAAPVAANPFAIPGVRKVRVDSQLNPNYVFENFIEGDCNKLARAAGESIAARPGKTSFNPFVVYGGVGLGKTHLVQAIGNYVQANGTAEHVLYVSSERFTAEFVQSIQQNRVSEFSSFYRQMDLLIVDDIQFFAGKEKTQEEFFHIFNDLHQAGKQIVLSADRPPKEIQGVEERLLSRFKWGLVADVKAPELETRIAILQRKAENDGIQLPKEVIEFIAHNITNNIRELEGSLIRLLAHATLRQQDIDLPLAKEVLKDLIRESRINLTIEDIQRIVCGYFQIPEDLVRAKTRKREVVQARQVAMFFCKYLTQNSLKTIGLHFGGRDHSTVIHANQSVEDQMETNPQFRDMIAEIRHKIEIQGR